MRYPTLALSFLASINAFAIDVSTPVLPAAAAALNVDIGLMQLTIGLYMLGYGIGQIPIGLMGDYFGRRITVIISLIIFILAGFVAVVAPSVELLLAMRFVQGVSGAAGAVISRAIARDITSGAGTGRLLGLLTATLGGVMIVGPLIGAMLLNLVGWWAPFVASAVFGFFVLVLLLTGIEETLKDRPDGTLGTRFIEGLTAFRNSPQARLSALLIAFAFCILMAFVTLASEVFIRQFAMGEMGYAVIFAIASTGYMLGGLACRRLVSRMSTINLARTTVAGFGLVGLASLLLLPVSASHPAALSFVMIVSFLCIGAMLSVSATLALEALPRNAGMASGIMGSFQILVGGSFSAGLSLIHADSLVILHLAVGGCGALMVATALATRRLTSDTLQ
ncbi:MAG: hypothetical protein CMM73_02870 [Rhodospirillaceae bacterium]|nr:hypothetical protein [Rhodospirillaceae bacterium]|tara:strand:- start:1508 stop:2686 length:1179 start_codon:yes stop_codon:yes gene_type:complete